MEESQINNPTSNGHGHDRPPQNTLSPPVIRAIFLLLGVGILIPWNAFVSAKSYFNQRLCEDGTVISNFELWFGLAWNSSSVLSLGIIIASVAIKDKWMQWRYRDYSSHDVDIVNSTSATADPLRAPDNDHQSDDGSSSHGSKSEGHSFWLVIVPLALYMILFAFTDALVLVTNIEAHTFLTITLIGLAICGTCGAIATAGIVSTAGFFQSEYGIIPFFSGQSLGGLAVALANFLAATFESPDAFWEQNCADKNVTDDSSESFSRRLDGHGLDEVDLMVDQTCTAYTNYDWAVFGYFMAGCFVLAGCLVGYTAVSNYQQAEHRDDYEAVHDTPQYEPVEEDRSSPTGLEMEDQSAQEKVATPQAEPEPNSYHDTPGPDRLVLHHAPSSMLESIGAHSGIATVDVEEYTEEEDEGAVLSAIKGPATAVVLAFAVTLSLFPNWVSKIRSAHECDSHFRLNNDLFVPFTFVVFNFGDLTGRVLAEQVPVQTIRHLSQKLVLAGLGRLIFFFLFVLCVTDELSGSVQSSRLVIIHSDLYSLTVLFLFAVTNGLLVSCSFMHSPHLVAHTTSMQERASEIMTFAVYFGLLTGSLLSFPFAELATKLYI